MSMPGDTMWKKERRIMRAAREVAETCGEALADKAGGFTCREAETINALLVDTNPYWATEFRAAHVRGDNEHDDIHHNGWEETP